MESKKIIFLCGMLSLPRCVSRVTALHNAGFNVKVYGYERDVFTNKFPPEIKVTVLSKFQNRKNYIRKFISVITDFFYLQKKYNHDDTIFYFLTIPFLPFLTFFIKNKFIYEISDIQYGYPKFILFQPVLKYLDRLCIRKSSLTVFTSGGFLDYFFKKKYPNNILIQPNKINLQLSSLSRNSISKASKILSFGFVGSIRFNNIYLFAKQVGLNFQQHKFKFFGGGTNTKRFEDLANNFKNIEFNGPFESPKDLHKIYSEIDIVVSCYDSNSLNVRLAEPNKLYESMAFSKPIIVSENTFLAKRVNELECGYCIDASCPNSINNFISGLNQNDLNELSNKIKNIQSHQFISDHDDMICKINAFYE